MYSTVFTSLILSKNKRLVIFDNSGKIDEGYKPVYDSNESHLSNPNILFKYFGSNINRNDICGEDGWKEKINSICEYTPSKKHKKVKRKNTIRKKRKSSKKK